MILKLYISKNNINYLFYIFNLFNINIKSIYFIFLYLNLDII